MNGSDEQRARDLKKQADKAKREGRKDIAEERLRQAWELFRDPWFMCHLGGLEMEMDKPRDAVQSLTACLRLLTPEDKQVIGPKVERFLKEALGKVGTLTVEANVPDAEVFVDGKAMGKLPLEDPIFVDPGSHGVEVRAPGYLPDTMMAFMRANTVLHLRMRLEPMPVKVAPLAPERAPSEPKPSEPTPKEEAKRPNPAPTPPLAVKAPAPVKSPERAEGPVRAPVRVAVIFSGFGLGVAGAVVGTAGFMAASSAEAEANAMYRAVTETPAKCTPELPGPCKGAEDKIETALALTAVGVAGFAMSAVGGAVLIYELSRSDTQGRKATARLAFEPTHGGGVVRVTGDF
ncbi:MAG TPA: PEGA domain-containing protein [Polyangiaceae bacterium]|nr:PEGA domain-containing protein [Polyangiaceae bacterium]